MNKGPNFHFYGSELIMQQRQFQRNTDVQYKPFVKWAGGKTQLLQQLYTLAPAQFNKYFEPFLGGGALFFYLISMENKRFTAYLSDINSELINSYTIVKNGCVLLTGFNSLL
jgi:site-specific DNA-adenine methylase